ncbi:hypothetical protein DV451_002242 [Geotrichum candidum]|uniref:ARID domain-containing protein n=1 Tax=Geotrichum candidum TaxID=1173061 RepID=A0A9P5G681_GEOCN|nr:hypothetical protein DV451_002242 [Geotrichum candidum]KAF5108118.1 hypothetical protein DV453_002556 [Geotrichum candidum]
MGALTRVAMDWLDRLVKFHQILSGSAIEKYPKIDDAGNVLIYYSLHKLVTSLGGFEKVSSQNLWSDVAAKLKLSQFGSDKARPIGDVLRTTYSTVILLFEQFLEFMEYAGVSNGDCQYKNCNLQATKKAFKKRNRLKHVKQHQVHLVSPKMETGKSAEYQAIKPEPDLRRAPDTPVINYQHFGETKTWYGIPGADAEKFEAAMRDTVPDLFEKQPNLLFQLVTMLSPEVLVEKGVRCYAIDQGPGEFVITFPKAYHAGFNHGFNCNEAVNFAPPDWLPFGQESVETYREYNRAPVFSHDSLVMRTARLDKREETARWLLPHVEALVSREIATRKDIVDKLQKLHVAGRSGTEARSAPNSVNCVAVPKLVTAEPASEEEYQCCICNSLPYLSKVVIRKRKPAPHHQQSGPGRRRKVAEQQLYEDSEDDDDLMELVFGRPGSGGLDDPETADAAGDDQLPTRPIDRLTVCSRHIPETVPACVCLDYEIHCTEQELLSLRDELSNRINHSHLPS